MNTESAKMTTPLFTKTIRGREVPTLGFGTFQLQGDSCRQAVSEALETGYRHVDTARMYENEEEVGMGIRDSSVNREEIFLTSKVWWEDLSPEAVKREIDASLSALKTDHLDLVLIHWPNPEFSLEAVIDTFKAMQQEGKLRHYGVSNFPSQWYLEACEYGDIFCNQVEYHPFLDQNKLLDLARERGSALTAYSPLAQGEAIGHPELETVAKKHGKSTHQIALRWLIEQERVLAIPRSSNPEHIRSNFDIFDFELDTADREWIARLPKNRRQVNPDFAPEWDPVEKTG